MLRYIFFSIPIIGVETSLHENKDMIYMYCNVVFYTVLRLVNRIAFIERCLLQAFQPRRTSLIEKPARQLRRSFVPTMEDILDVDLDQGWQSKVMCFRVLVDLVA